MLVEDGLHGLLLDEGGSEQRTDRETLKGAGELGEEGEDADSANGVVLHGASSVTTFYRKSIRNVDVTVFDQNRDREQDDRHDHACAKQDRFGGLVTVGEGQGSDQPDCASRKADVDGLAPS